MPTLHAVLVGINTYAHPNINPLSLCEQDVDKIEDLLGRFDSFTPDIKKIPTKEATKENICDAICEHFGDVNEGDLLVVYFSGHGCQEKSDRIWKTLDNDRDLECLVCYDFDFAGNGCLADKEIRFLLNMVTKDKKVELITIFDSCHSGDATRGDIIPKRIPEPVEMRTWDQFIFSEDLPLSEFQKVPSLNEILPNAGHIHFAACRDIEVAYQSMQGSIFTNILIDVVEQSGSNISYRELQSRIHRFVRNKYLQTPVIEPVNKGNDAMDQLFLTGGLAEKKTVYNLAFSTKHNAWVADIGRIHGLSSHSSDSLGVFLNGQKAGTGKITEVRLNETLIQPDQGTALDSRLAYAIEISGLYRVPTNIFLQGAVLGMSVLEKVIQRATDDLRKFNIHFVKDIALADFTVLATKKIDKGMLLNAYHICPPFVFAEEQEAIDFADPVPEFIEESALLVLEKLKKVAHWNYVKGINNLSPLQNAISVHLETISGSSITLNYPNPVNLGSGAKIRFRFKNISDKRVYLYALMLTQAFTVDSLTGENSYILDQEKFIYGPREGHISVFSSYPALPYETMWIKLIIATEEIRLSSFIQSGLLSANDSRGRARGPGDAPNDDFSAIDETWATITCEVRVKITPANP